jgi:hypothetical protein
MLRALVLATVFATLPLAAAAQEPGTLRITIAIAEPGQPPAPVARHALLISDNPATAPPRRVVTGSDGTATVTLRPGSYIAESDRPVAFNGKAYQWTELVEIAAGREVTLSLTAETAEVVPLAASTPAATPGEAPDTDPSFLLARWRGSVVAVWTPTTRASAFVVDRRGLLATSQRVVGAATSVEVQVSPSLKVAARVLASDQARDVAVLWIDPKPLGEASPVSVDCAEPAPRLVEGQDLFAISASPRGLKSLERGTVGQADRQGMRADFRLGPGSTGGPVFTAEGLVVGLTSPLEDADARARVDSRLVPTGAMCEVLTGAAQRMPQITPPAPTPLPVEPSQPFPREDLEEAGQRRATNLMPPQVSSSDYDVTFITPPTAHAAQLRGDRTTGRARAGGGTEDVTAETRKRLLTDFANWSEYVADLPPVLLVRVTPRLKEGFWTLVGRAAAMTQGVQLPPMKRPAAGFARMQVFCGSTEVTPIHPFVIEQRLTGTDTIHEGLYVLDPGALGPHCGTVRITLFSEKEPGKGDSRVVDPKIVEQIWNDFAPTRPHP